MRFLLLTGMSGAGKTAALRYLEDMGVFCVDNLPPNMVVRFIESFETSQTSLSTAALSVDVRSRAFFDAHAIAKLLLETQTLGYHVETVFLEASDDVLVSRYKESRREHPLANDRVTLTEAIGKERNILQPLRETANYLIDTTNLKLRALQKKLEEIVSIGTVEGPQPMRIEVMSFGFKRGLPKSADLVFDVRFLPNPFYIPELCRHSGMDEDVRDFVMNNEVTRAFMTKITDMLDFLIPNYQNEGKHRMVIAIGCTGGAHRSVAITEAVGAHLKEAGYQTMISHRDVDVEQAHWKNNSDVD
ncbi:MAG: RNase adapter RapZ [Clostridiales bacterium]|nr:RNase adapter RapZ [Clostridia bacterium]MCR4882902.1 RNase adapter RapZ [Clostridiales bacterium]